VKPLLSVENLKTCFELDEGTVKAVDGASFKLYPRKILGIVGESGCGKSMTIKSILRIVEKPGRITSGKIMFQSTKSQGKAESKTCRLSSVGAALQTNSFHTWKRDCSYTSRTNVRLQSSSYYRQSNN